MDNKKAEYLIFDVSSIDKPKDYQADFSETSAWPRVIHLSWIMLDKEYKPLQDFDCIIKPEGFSLTKKILSYAKLEQEEMDRRGQDLDPVLHKFSECVDDSSYVFAHNMTVSENILAAEYLRRGISHSLFRAERYCLMQESTYYCKIPSKRGGYKWPSLRELHAICFQQAYTPSGNARADVIAATRCFIKLMKTGNLEDLFD